MSASGRIGLNRNLRYRCSSSYGGKSKRSATGQAIAESAAGLVMTVTVVTALLMLMINVYNGITYKSRLELVAAEAAKVYEGNKWFLGMRRKEFEHGRTAQVAGNLAAAMCTELGLPALSGQPVFENKTTNGGISYVVCTVSVKMGLPYINDLFPSVVGLTAKGVSSGQGMAIHPPAVVNFSARSTTTFDKATGEPRLIGCQLPGYALYTNRNEDFPGAPNSGPSSIKMPYAYTGFSMGKDTTPMLRTAEEGDATALSEWPAGEQHDTPFSDVHL